MANDGPNGTSKLTFAGFYSERGTYSIKGSYFFRLDPKETAITDRQAFEFDFNFLTAFMSNKNKQRALEATERNDARKRRNFSTTPSTNWCCAAMGAPSHCGAILCGTGLQQQ